MAQTRIATSDEFALISRDSIERGFNRLPSDELLEDLDPEGTHVVTFNMPHEHIAGVQVEPHQRTMWLVKTKDKAEDVEVTLDMTQEHFDSLTQVREREEGGWEVVIGAYGVGRKQ